MPQPEIDELSPDSKKGQRSAAISECIRREVAGGKSQDQAIAMCQSMALDKTKKPESGGE